MVRVLRLCKDPIVPYNNSSHPGLPKEVGRPRRASPRREVQRRYRPGRHPPLQRRHHLAQGASCVGARACPDPSLTRTEKPSSSERDPRARRRERARRSRATSRWSSKGWARSMLAFTGRSHHDGDGLLGYGCTFMTRGGSGPGSRTGLVRFMRACTDLVRCSCPWRRVALVPLDAIRDESGKRNLRP